MVPVVGTDLVTFDGMVTVAHRQDRTQLPHGLGEIGARIFERIDSFVEDLGKELQEAFDRYPADYERWVTECLPFGLDKARRLRMVYKASLHLPPEVRERLPRPWQALYAVTRLPPETLTEAVESGTVHSEMTVREAQETTRTLSGRETKRFSEVDLLVGRLVKLPRSTLGPDAEGLLTSWFSR